MRTLSPLVVVALAAACRASRPATVPSPDAGPPAGVVVASNMLDHTATLLDARTGATLATLPTGRGPHEVAISHDGRWALVSNYGPREQPGSSITVIDVAARAVARTIDLGDVRRPHGMAFLPADSAFVVTAETRGAVLVVDFATGRVLRTLPSNGRATHMLGVSADGRRAVTANIVDGTITVLDLRGDVAPRVLPVAHQPEGVAITPDGTTAWVGSNRDSVVSVVDLERGVVRDTIHGFALPYRIAIAAAAPTVVVTDPARGEVRVLDAQSRRPRFVLAAPSDSLVSTAEVAGSPSPEGVTVTPDGRWAFVTLQGRNRVIAIDLARQRVAWTGVSGAWSDGIGYAPLAMRR